MIGGRGVAVAMVVAVASAGAAAPANAADWFAVPDESRTAQTCRTAAQACALGVAVEKLASGEAHTLTLAPGTYDLADIDAGAGADPGVLILPPRVTLLGAQGQPAPVIRSDAPSTLPTVRISPASELRGVAIVRTGSAAAPAVRAAGTQTPDAPATIDHVRVDSSGAAGVATSGVVRLRSVLIAHTGGAGTAAIDVNVSAVDRAPTPAPVLLGVTALASGGGDALDVHADGEAAQQASAANSVFSGAVAVRAERSAGGVPGQVTLVARNVAWPAAPTLSAGGAVDLGGTVPVAFTAGMLEPSGLPVAGSPLVDAGAVVEQIGGTDLAGGKRVVGAAPDLGALERQDGAPAAPGASTATDDWGTDAGGWDDALADTLEPWITVTSKVSKLSRSKLAGSKGLTLTITTDEAATAKVELITTSKVKGKTKEKVIASAQAKSTAAGAITLKLKIKRSKLPKAGTKATLRFTATDAAGNVGRESAPTKLS